MMLYPLKDFSQELSFGDSSIVSFVDAKTLAVYDHKDTMVFFLTKTSFISQPVFAANITCYIKENAPNRIVVSYTTKEGILSKEFFLEHDDLFYCYETMEYFDSAENKTSWRNFKNLPAYESRYYFKNEEIVYQKHSGLQAAIPDKEYQLKKEKEKLLAYIKLRFK